jgi:arsenite methyltransferase
VAGALTERDFVAKLEKAGFEEVEVVSRDARSVDDSALYPLFTTEVIELMRRLLSPERQQRVTTAIVLRAQLPAATVNVS